MDDVAAYVERNFVSYFDVHTMEKVDSFELNEYEMGLSITSAILGEVNSNEGESSSRSAKVYVVVGTAYVIQDEPEPSTGRILVFEVLSSKRSASGKLNLVAEIETKGAVYSISAFRGSKIVTGINSKRSFFSW